MNHNYILNMDPEKLIEWLVQEFYVEIPEQIVSIEDMENASRLLLLLSNKYSYLVNLLSYAKIASRQAKREKDKQKYEDMVDRKEIIQNMVDSVKNQYAAVSRSVTIHIENNAELRMNTSGHI